MINGRNIDPSAVAGGRTSGTGGSPRRGKLHSSGYEATGGAGIPAIGAVLMLLFSAAACVPGTTRTGAPPAAGEAAAVSGTLVLMSTTDVHGWLRPFDYYTGETTKNGLALLLPLADSIRAAHPGATVLLDSGDFLQGNPLAFVASRSDTASEHPVVAAMNFAGYDAAAIGNHEFNYGLAHLRRAIGDAGFPFLTANVFTAGSGEHAFQPFAIVGREIGGVPLRVGITAVTPPGVLLWDRDIVTGKLDFGPVTKAIAEVVPRMRSAGADVIVVAAHSGLEGSSYDPDATGVPAENEAAAIARQVLGVDVIFMGHTHAEVADTSINGVLLVQAKNWAGSLGVAELQMRFASGEWRITGKRGSTLRPNAAADTAVLRVTAAIDSATRAYTGRTIGQSAALWTAAAARTRDTPVLDLINETQRRAAGTQLSGTAAFSLSSRISEGPVTVADIAGLYIYDNTLKALRISGRQLREYLEKSAEYYLPCPAARCDRLTNPAVPGYNFDVLSGAEYELDLSRPVGERVVKLQYQGEAVAPQDSFSIALNNYRASGSGGFEMFADAPVIYDRGENIRDLLISEVERRGTLDPADVFRENWWIVPPALAAQALREQAANASRR